MASKFWTFLNSQIFLLVVGFLLTGMVGHYLTTKYQDASWERDRKYEVFKQEIEEAKKTLEEVNLHISDRTYSLQKVHWKLESRDLDGAVVEYGKYIDIKDNWNKKIRIYRNKLKRLVDHDLAFLLLDSENSVNVPKKESVHAYFADAHTKTRSWLKCLKSNCDDISKKEKMAYDSLKELFQTTDYFIDESYSIFLRKYKHLHESPSNSALTNGSSATANASP
ncbi:hypothetical protein CYL31_14325 [Marinomonas sp. A3A]|uniref:hypothetical protein n=1 Tax=Marinomonas sp. A3A TaxID=2065312 RepID=UPI001BB37906|nr:hypothetical protein [Marinomonas sp. A3A]QUX92503.1 hypothetical protein CYL31_14325 [Marinomonas sp. A3A]